MRLRSGFLIAMVALAGCTTPYQGGGISGGVTAVPIAQDVFLISARGNGYTAASTVENHVLLKAAETTLAAGSTHFIVVDSKDSTLVTSGVDPLMTSVDARNTFGKYSSIGYEIKQPGRDTLIEVFSLGEGKAPPPGSFDAAEVYKNLRGPARRLY